MYVCTYAASFEAVDKKKLPRTPDSDKDPEQCLRQLCGRCETSERVLARKKGIYRLFRSLRLPINVFPSAVDSYPVVIMFKSCCVGGCAHLHRVIRTEKPSSHWPHVPETPQIMYPRGGIRVCLIMLVKPTV